MDLIRKRLHDNYSGIMRYNIENKCTALQKLVLKHMYMTKQEGPHRIGVHSEHIKQAHGPIA